MSGNKSYDKGYRFEKKIQAWLSQYGRCDRAHQSGAYTGEQDLKWWQGFRAWSVDCKCGKNWIAKRYRERLETADLCVDGDRGEIPIVHILLPKFLEMCGDEAPTAAPSVRAGANTQPTLGAGGATGEAVRINWLNYPQVEEPDTEAEAGA